MLRLFYIKLYHGELPLRDPLKDAPQLSLTSEVRCPHCRKVMNRESELAPRRWQRKPKNKRVVSELWPVAPDKVVEYLKKWTGKIKRDGLMFVMWRDDEEVLMMGLNIMRPKDRRYRIARGDFGDIEPGWPKYLR